ncbi:MAG: glutaredoxin family protein [Actinomycetota bacterium]
MNSRPDPPRVVLYSKDGCHLCEDAAEMLRALGIEFLVAHDPAFDERIPVIKVDGRIVTEGRVSMRPVRAALKRQPKG